MSVYQHHVGLTRPLMTYMGHPRDHLSISDSWPHPFWILSLPRTSRDPGCAGTVVQAERKMRKWPLNTGKGSTLVSSSFTFITRYEDKETMSLRWFCLTLRGTVELKLCNLPKKEHWHAKLQNSVRMFSTPGLIRDVPKQGGISSVAQFVWTYENTKITLWYGTKELSWDKWGDLCSILFEPWSDLLAVRTQLPGNGCHKSTYKSWPRTFMDSCLRVALFNRAFAAPLFQPSLTILWTSLFFALSQHLGNVFICQNVDEAFHLLAVAS